MDEVIKSSSSQAMVSLISCGNRYRRGRLGSSNLPNLRPDEGTCREPFRSTRRVYCSASKHIAAATARGRPQAWHASLQVSTKHQLTERATNHRLATNSEQKTATFCEAPECQQPTNIRRHLSLRWWTDELSLLVLITLNSLRMNLHGPRSLRAYTLKYRRQLPWWNISRAVKITSKLIAFSLH
jgi:hypothetical protein